MKELWRGFRRWVHYIFEYKDNVTYLEIKEQEASEKDKLINELTQEIKRLKTQIKTKNQRHEIVSKKYRDTKRKLDEKSTNVTETKKRGRPRKNG